MEEKFKDKYRIPPARLTTWDYGAHGLYYVTICTMNRNHYFGEIVPSPKISDQAELQATEIGAITEENWQAIPSHYPFVELD